MERLSNERSEAQLDREWKLCVGGEQRPATPTRVLLADGRANVRESNRNMFCRKQQQSAEQFQSSNDNSSVVASCSSSMDGFPQPGLIIMI